MFNVLCPSTSIIFVVSESHFAPNSDVMFSSFKVGKGTNLSPCQEACFEMSLSYN